MWGAGGAAALSPFPLLDLAAGCAISTKMVVELAKVYRQDVDLNRPSRCWVNWARTCWPSWA